jgi:hypothetical protein
VRLVLPAVCVVFAFNVGCGYIGPVSPPSAEIPVPVTNLTAVERGDQIEVEFSTPRLTTDLLEIKRFSEIELRAGPAETPFDPVKWEASSKQYELASPPAIDADDPQSVPVKAKIPVSDWQGQKITVAVRTAVKSGKHLSQWSAPANLEVIEPLQKVKATAAPTSKGYKLTWDAAQSGLQYNILRGGPGQTPVASVGTVDTNSFVDATSQWDVPYTYFVVAKKNNAESVMSDGVPVNSPDKFPPSVPQGVTALAGPESVELRWSRSPESDLKAYRIYRAVGTARSI